MRAFKNKWFTRWARDEGIQDGVLWKSAEEIISGRVEADLGKCLYKKRIAKRGQGKSGSYRLIVAYKKPNSSRIFFISAFDKGDKSNLTPKEKEAYSKVAAMYVELSDDIIEQLKQIHELFEIEELGHE